MATKKEGDKVAQLATTIAPIVNKTIVTPPIDRIKLLLQTQGALLRSGRLDRPYRGAIDCLQRTVAKEGYLALYRGNSPNILRVFFPTQTLHHVLYPKLKKAFEVPRDASYQKKFATNILVGGLAGAIGSVFLYPLDFARARLATNIPSATTGRTQFAGLIDLYRQTLRSDGINGIYRGFGASLLGAVAFRGIYFGLYDSIRTRQPASYITPFFMAWGTTTLALFASYPINTVWHRMMMMSCEKVKYNSSVHAFWDIVKQEGPSALYKGAGVNIIRGLVGSLVLLGFDKLTYNAL